MSSRGADALGWRPGHTTSRGDFATWSTTSGGDLMLAHRLAALVRLGVLPKPKHRDVRARGLGDDQRERCGRVVVTVDDFEDDDACLGGDLEV